MCAFFDSKSLVMQKMGRIEYVGLHVAYMWPVFRSLYRGIRNRVSLKSSTGVMYLVIVFAVLLKNQADATRYK